MTNDNVGRPVVIFVHGRDQMFNSREESWSEYGVALWAPQPG